MSAESLAPTAPAPSTDREPIVLLAILAQECDESARSFTRLAERQAGLHTQTGLLAAKNARRDATMFAAKADACRAGMRALAKEEGA